MAREVREVAVETTAAAYDLWDFWDYGERLECASPRTLLNFLSSAGTRAVRVTGTIEGIGATFELTGPVDDAGEHSLLVCRLDTAQAREELNGAEIEQLVRAVKRHDEDFFRRNTRDAARALNVPLWRVAR